MAWCEQHLNKRGIRNICRKKILDNIFYPMKEEDEWKVLIVDDFAMKIISSCFKTEEVMSYNIALIENLESTKEPLQYLSVIYILFPSVQNIGNLQADFVSAIPKYKSANLFFLTEVPEEQFKELLKYVSPGFIATFKEIDFLFLPYESQVFTLYDESFFSIFFDAYKELDINYCAFIAKKLVTFCTVLNVRPRIRYRRNFIKNFIIAEAVQKELRLMRESLPSTSCSEIGSQPRCELLILDRGFDCISPVLHEFTLQAMATDLLDIEDDIYTYQTEDEENTEIINHISLTESESFWCKLRHEHIANVAKVIDSKSETSMLLRRYPKISRYKKIPDLGEAVRRHLAFRKTQSHIIFKRMANECMKAHCNGINVISEVEQNLALGTTSEQTAVQDAYTSVMNIISNENYSIPQRLRVLLLYIFFSKGITKQELDDMIKKSQLPFSEACIITNVLHLDIDIFRPGFCVALDIIPAKDIETSGYKQSRWKPAVTKVMLNCVEGRLSQDKYPYIDSKEHEIVTSVKRTGYWCTDKKDEHMSRLIVFIAGGITYSEMRSAYEVMDKYKGWEIFIGGDSILTPKKFLNKLKELRCFIYKDV